MPLPPLPRALDHVVDVSRLTIVVVYDRFGLVLVRLVVGALAVAPHDARVPDVDVHRSPE